MIRRFTPWPLSAACAACLLTAVLLAVSARAADDGKVQRFVRYESQGKASYGLLEGKLVRRIEGDLFGKWKATDDTVALDQVKLLVPTTPTQVLAMAGNYQSHLGDGGTVTTITTVTKVTTDAKNNTTSDSNTTIESRNSDEVPKLFQTPQPFYKSPSCLTANGTNIVLPRDVGVVHYEAEMVVVIGKTARNVPREDALDYVFGVTCGNDVSAREWQKGDVQWWRAKGSDTFGPCGPAIVCGLDYDNLMMELRLNGEVRQKESTKQLIHDVAGTLSFISRYVTLHPGDLIFTGTPGQTDEIKAGDVVEVEIEGVGVLRNKVVREE
jgi:2-keto-4-pentenoate hydratase/2-oxohepta-3-ene-1,7-dioic acid hydratase in catechol pathway